MEKDWEKLYDEGELHENGWMPDEVAVAGRVARETRQNSTSRAAAVSGRLAARRDWMAVIFQMVRIGAAGNMARDGICRTGQSGSLGGQCG